MAKMIHQMSTIRVNTAELLAKAQRALEIGKATNDTALIGAAESVLSALMVVANRRIALLPESSRKFVNIVLERSD